jgi:hypothetical protein
VSTYVRWPPWSLLAVGLTAFTVGAIVMAYGTAWAGFFSIVAGSGSIALYVDRVLRYLKDRP